MKLKEKIQIKAPAEKVWEYIGNPETWTGFNPKVVVAERTSGSDPGVGAWYRLDYTMSKRTARHTAQVAEWIPSERIRLEATAENSFSPGGKGGVVNVEILYQLSERRGTTTVQEIFDIRNHGLNIFWVALITLIHGTGKPVEPSGLMRLKEMLENG